MKHRIFTISGWVVAALVLGLGGVRWAQSGYVRSYAFMTLIGAVLLVMFLLFRL